jgi:hypothetical protein
MSCFLAAWWGSLVRVCSHAAPRVLFFFEFFRYRRSRYDQTIRAWLPVWEVVKFSGSFALFFAAEWWWLMASPNTAWWQQLCVYHFVGTPSAESCSKHLFPTRVSRGFISNSRGMAEMVNSSFSSYRTCKIKLLPCVPNSGVWLPSTRFRISKGNSRIKVK